MKAALNFLPSLTTTASLMRRLGLGLVVVANAVATVLPAAQAAERDERGSQRQDQRDDERQAGPGTRAADQDKAREKEREKEHERDNDREKPRDHDSDDDRDRAKVQVSLTIPAVGTIYSAPATVTLTATAQSSQKNHPVSKVEFYQGTTLIGTATAAPYSTTWSNAPAGRYSLTAKAYSDKAEKREDKGKDGDGKGKDGTDKKDKDVAVSAAVDIVVNALPTVAMTSPTPSQVVTAPGSVTLTATAADTDGTIARVEFYNGATLIGTATSAPYTATWSNVPAGSYSLTAKATDDKGGVTTSAPVAVIVNGLPTVSLTSPTANAIIAAPASITVTATATDTDGTIARVEFYNGATLIGTATSAPYTATWSNVPAGSYSLTAKATDNLGGTTTSALVAVIVNGLPTVSLTSPTANAIIAAPASITVTATATDTDGSIAKVDFYQGATLIGTATVAPYSITWSTVPAGSYSLTAIATDDKGGVTTSAPVAVIVNGLPTVSLTSPTANAIIAAPASITVTATAADTDGSIAKVDFYQGATLIGTATAAPYSITWSTVPSGSYSLTATATDNLGGQVSSAPVLITVDAPPTVTLTSPTAGAVGIAPASFTLTANAADSDGTIAKVEFFQNGSLIGTATSAPHTVSWSNVSPGNFSLTASATDNLGIQTTSPPITVSVIANSPPTINLTSPTPNHSVKAPATITLTANASDPDNNLAKVEFVQNGTLIATLLTPPYTTTWSNVPQGSYQITAIATDAIGAQTTSDSVTITVTPAQASLYFIHPDHLGTPRLVTDEQNTVVWRHLPTTEPFGNTPPEEDPQATGNRFEMPLAFPGQYRDKESNLNYNFFRDYDPFGGRYRQSDPIGLAGGVNTYSYVGGNPISRIDPRGLTWDKEFPAPQDPMRSDGTSWGNGCGDAGTDAWVPDGYSSVDFTPACQKHDACYDTCGNKKNTCDNQFKDNLYEQCKKGGGGSLCRWIADRYYGAMTTKTSKSAYDSAQKGACKCP